MLAMVHGEEKIEDKSNPVDQLRTTKDQKSLIIGKS